MWFFFLKIVFGGIVAINLPAVKRRSFCPENILDRAAVKIEETTISRSIQRYSEAPFQFFFSKGVQRQASFILMRAISKYLERTI